MEGKIHEASSSDPAIVSGEHTPDWNQAESTSGTPSMIASSNLRANQNAPPSAGYSPMEYSPFGIASNPTPGLRKPGAKSFAAPGSFPRPPAGTPSRKKSRSPLASVTTTAYDTATEEYDSGSSWEDEEVVENGNAAGPNSTFGAPSTSYGLFGRPQADKLKEKVSGLSREFVGMNLGARQPNSSKKSTRAPPSTVPAGLGDSEGEKDDDGLNTDFANHNPFRTHKPAGPTLESFFFDQSRVSSAVSSSSSAGPQPFHRRPSVQCSDELSGPESQARGNSQPGQGHGPFSAYMAAASQESAAEAPPSFASAAPRSFPAPKPDQLPPFGGSADAHRPAKPAAASFSEGSKSSPKVKVRPSPKKLARRLPKLTRMNGQPLSSKPKEAASGSAAPPPPSKPGPWEQYAGKLQKEKEAAQQQQSKPTPPAASPTFHTPEIAKPASPGPIPMSGIQYSGPGFASSPHPANVPQPSKAFIGTPPAKAEPEAGDGRRRASAAQAAAPAQPAANFFQPRNIFQPAAQNPFVAQPAAPQSPPLASVQNPFAEWHRAKVPDDSSARRPAAKAHEVGPRDPTGLLSELSPSKSKRTPRSRLRERNRRNRVAPSSASKDTAEPPAPGAPQVLTEQQLLRRRVKTLHNQGNEYHKLGKFDLAISAYQEAIKLLEGASLVQETAVLYNNLAASSLQLSQPSLAAKFAARALKADAKYWKAEVRMGTALWHLGNLAAAAESYKIAQAVPSGSSEAAGKLRELAAFTLAFQKVAQECEGADSPEAVSRNLQAVSRLLEQSCQNQNLLSLKAHCLLRLNRLEEAYKLATSDSKAAAGVAAWPRWVKAQAAFLSGQLDKAADQLEQLVRLADRTPEVLQIESGRKLDKDSLRSMVLSLRSLLELKEAGNREQNAKRSEAAIQRYTAALGAGGEAPPAFAAVLHSNRAAALQSRGQVAEAIADCLRAKALDASYAKAYSRLAALLGECGLHEAAVAALEELGDLGGQPDASARLADAKRELLRKPPTNHYRVLGLPTSCSQDEIRRAYKKLALMFHPDKALAQCKFAASLGQGATLVTASEVEKRVKEGANWVFQVISSASNVLLDPDKRRRLDADLALHNASRWATRQDYGAARSSRAQSFAFRKQSNQPHYGEDPGDESYFRGSPFSNFYDTGPQYHKFRSNRGYKW